MGIDVVNKRVFHSTSHQQRVDTSVSGNPQSKIISGSLTVQSIFRRMVHREGDGNPLIYALKKKDGFSISNREFCKFLPEFRQILAKAMHGKSDVIFVPMPSSHKIAYTLASQAAKYAVNCSVEPSLFEKKTAGEVHQELKATVFPNKLRKDGVRLLSSLAASPNAIFSMKNVKNPELRHYISPLKLATVYPVQCREIILVDDLLSSGATLTCAHDQLQASGWGAISALCLLGAL